MKYELTILKRIYITDCSFEGNSSQEHGQHMQLASFLDVFSHLLTLLLRIVYVHLWYLVAKIYFCVVGQAFNAFVLQVIRGEEFGVGVSFLHGCVVVSIRARPLFVDVHFVQNSLDLLLLRDIRRRDTQWGCGYKMNGIVSHLSL